MSRIRIEDASCDRSAACPARRVCPKGAIVPLGGGSYPGANGYVVLQERCAGCGVCVRVCPSGAVTLG